jgi:hypothetical protein
MALDLSKLTDAVAKVAALAASVATVAAERDAAVQAVVQAQTDVDALTAQLLAAASTPAEAAGIAAVSAALVAPVAPEALVVPALGPVTPAFAGTFLPGDPRAQLPQG